MWLYFQVSSAKTALDCWTFFMERKDMFSVWVYDGTFIGTDLTQSYCLCRGSSGGAMLPQKTLLSSKSIRPPSSLNTAPSHPTVFSRMRRKGGRRRRERHWWRIVIHGKRSRIALLQEKWNTQYTNTIHKRNTQTQYTNTHETHSVSWK
jgi:hypothetical protein